MENQPPQVYVYDTNCWNDSPLGRFLDWVCGLRYMAYSGPWPDGRRLAWGRTPESARQKGVIELARHGKERHPKRVL